MTDRQLYLIDQHHQKKLSPEEQIEFESEMNSKDFASYVDLGVEIAQVSRIVEGNKFRNKVQNWENQSTSKKIKPLYILLLLGSAILMYLMYNFFTHSLTNQPKQLYAEYARPYKNIHVHVVRSFEDNTSIRKKAMQAYENKEYAEAIDEFDKIRETDVQAGDRFYLGLSYLLSGDIDSAQRLMTQLEKDEKFGVPAQWYSFLIALKDQNTVERDRLINNLMYNTTHPHLARQAKEIDERLNR